MKKMLVLWGIVAIFAVGGITYIGLNMKKENVPYYELEKELEKQAIALVGEKPTMAYNGNKITIDMFKENNYNINMLINSDVCDGYVVLEQNMGIYKYHPYIKCSKYTTSGYKNS